MLVGHMQAVLAAVEARATSHRQKLGVSFWRGRSHTKGTEVPPLKPHSLAVNVRQPPTVRTTHSPLEAGSLLAASHPTNPDPEAGWQPREAQFRVRI